MSEVNYDLLNRPFPKEAILMRKGANGQFLSYVQTSSVVQRIIDSTGNDWNFRILNIEQMGDVVVAHVELEIGGNTRHACGTARLLSGNNEDVVKIAVADSLKKAFSWYSKGYQSMWGPDYEAVQPAPAPAPRPAQTAPQNVPQGGNGGSNGGGYRRANQVRTGGFRPLQSQA